MLHFSNVRNLDYLDELFCKYKQKAVNFQEDAKLDCCLQNAGFYLSPKHSDTNEGYMTESQKRQFIKGCNYIRISKE